MLLTDIRLQNYRSYQDSSFELTSGVTIVVGPNATGKSNLIEAVLLASNATAYRGKQGLINNKADWARIDVHTDKNISRTVKITQKQEKDKPDLEFIINKKAYKRLPNPQKQPAVLFEPNDLMLLHGEPQARRDYLDDLASELNDGLGQTLQRYKRALSQRNALLKTPRLDESQLFVWNIRLCELAETIVKKRLAAIEAINSKISETYSRISSKKTGLNLEYKTRIGLKSYSANLLKRLEVEQKNDHAKGFTGNGPHREDFAATLDEQPVAVAASRGETRSLLLTLKIIEMELLEEKTGNKPLLLLDDVFSELDGARRKALTRFLKKYQTIITTTDADIVLKNFSQNCQIIPLG